MIIVDTSVLIQLFRGENTVQTKYLSKLEREGIELGIPAICIQEVLQGALDTKEFNLLKKHLLSQKIIVPEDPISTHVEASKIYFDSRRNGHTIRSTVDCLIAQLSLELKAPLLHADRDYLKILEVRPLLFPNL